MPEIRTAYLYAAKMATIFETTKFVAHNFLFNVSAIPPQKKLRTLGTLRTLETLGTLGTFFGEGRVLSRG